MIKDRVVQAAVVLVIEPIFEADFEDCSYGFRPGRSAHQALERIATELKAGKTEVYDADLEGYFDSIPHDKLMKCVRMRVVDGAVLGLIKQWLEAPVVEEIREKGKPDSQPRYKVTRNTKGTPQGGVTTPRTQKKRRSFGMRTILSYSAGKLPRGWSAMSARRSSSGLG